MKTKAKKAQTSRYAAALAEVEAMKRGEKTGARVTTPAEMVKALRTRLGLSQAGFAARFAVPVGTIRDWENGRRNPEGSALALLRVIAYAPDVVERALAETA
jgi:putative transcriptional regulator